MCQEHLRKTRTLALQTLVYPAPPTVVLNPKSVSQTLKFKDTNALSPASRMVSFEGTRRPSLVD